LGDLVTRSYMRVRENGYNLVLFHVILKKGKNVVMIASMIENELFSVQAMFSRIVGTEAGACEFNRAVILSLSEFDGEPVTEELMTLVNCRVSALLAIASELISTETESPLDAHRYFARSCVVTLMWSCLTFFCERPRFGKSFLIKSRITYLPFLYHNAIFCYFIITMFDDLINLCPTPQPHHVGYRK
jgi:hypothetical protein